MKSLQIDGLMAEIHESRKDMGRAAADKGLCFIREALAEQEEVNLIFAAAPSQLEMLEALRQAAALDWGRVNAFHMDNYVGLDERAPQQFTQFLKRNLFSHLPFRRVHYMGSKPGQEKDYEELLRKSPISVCFLGIGENGHVAFNDPGNAFFEDPCLVKSVQLDHACRMQQVHEGNFRRLDEVPTHALTLTVPALMGARHLICTVPGPNKAAAAKAMLEGPITEELPASVLRRHPSAFLYLDKEAASKLA